MNVKSNISVRVTEGQTVRRSGRAKKKKSLEEKEEQGRRLNRATP